MKVYVSSSYFKQQVRLVEALTKAGWVVCPLRHDLDVLAEADVCIVGYPSSTASAMVEAGYAIGLLKPLILVADEPEEVPLALRDRVSGVCTSVEQVRDQLDVLVADSTVPAAT